MVAGLAWWRQVGEEAKTNNPFRSLPTLLSIQRSQTERATAESRRQAPWTEQKHGVFTRELRSGIAVVLECHCFPDAVDNEEGEYPLPWDDLQHIFQGWSIALRRWRPKVVGKGWSAPARFSEM